MATAHLHAAMKRMERAALDRNPPPRIISVSLFEGGPTPPEDTAMHGGRVHRRQGAADPTPISAGAKVYLFDVDSEV